MSRRDGLAQQGEDEKTENRVASGKKKRKKKKNTRIKRQQFGVKSSNKEEEEQQQQPSRQKKHLATNRAPKRKHRHRCRLGLWQLLFFVILLPFVCWNVYIATGRSTTMSDLSNYYTHYNSPQQANSFLSDFAVSFSDKNTNSTVDAKQKGYMRHDQRATQYGNAINTSSSALENIQMTRTQLQETLPPWLMEFIDWQQAQLGLLTKRNWRKGNFRFLLLRCTENDYGCGGIADRLKPLPLLLRIAYETKRIFLIRWTRPYPLQEFLMPTEHFNWTVPWYIEHELKHLSRAPPIDYHLAMRATRNHRTVTRGHVPKLKRSQAASQYWDFNINTEDLYTESNADWPLLLETKKQMGDGGEKFLSQHILTDPQHPPYQSYYRGLFRALFQPSPGVANLLRDSFATYRLTPGEYTVAHYRSFYAVKMEEVSQEKIQAEAKNAIHCASQLHPGFPIYFASDSAHASKVVQQTFGNANTKTSVYTNLDNMQQQQQQNTTTSNTRRQDPLHLDFAGKGNRTWPVEAYYDGFVDLLLLGNSQCISYGQGGYGTFANLLSFDANCQNRHTQKRGRIIPCMEFMQPP